MLEELADISVGQLEEVQHFIGLYLNKQIDRNEFIYALMGIA